MPPKKNKRIVTIIIVLFSLFLLSGSYFLPRQYGLAFSRFCYPVITPLAEITKELYNVLRTVKNIRHIGNQNKDLKIKIQQLQREIDKLQEIYIENTRLRNLLAFKEAIDYQTLPAKVIGREPTNWYESLIVDKGRDDGVMINMPVVSYGGVVGKIVEVSKENAMILLITDRKSKIGAVLQETRYTGIVKGESESICRMDYILKDAELKAGATVVSSGFGGIYPKGLKIGVVEKIYKEKYGLYKYVSVIPSVDFNRVEEVLIILKKNDQNTF